jgi:hypothetical protein
MVGAELRIDMVVPLLEGESEALFMKTFWVERMSGRARDEDDLKSVSAFVVRLALGGFTVCDRADFEE